MQAGSVQELAGFPAHFCAQRQLAIFSKLSSSNMKILRQINIFKNEVGSPEDWVQVSALLCVFGQYPGTV